MTKHTTPGISTTHKTTGKVARKDAPVIQSMVKSVLTKDMLGLPPSGRRRGSGSGFAPSLSGGRGQFMQAPKTGRWALVGQGPLADAMAAAWPFANTKLVQWPTYDKDAPLVDGIIETMPGVSAALDIGLLALARGIPLVTANALLLATHGPVLAAAAQGHSSGGIGSLLGMEGAALGSLPVQGLLSGALGATACFGGSADRILQRMRYRSETAAAAETAVRQQRHDAGQMGSLGGDDVNGKQTLVRMVVMHALWSGVWLNPARQQRLGLDAVRAEDFATLQSYGLTLRYGATMRKNELYVGPLAVRETAFALDGHSLLVDGPAGLQQLTTSGNDIARAVHGMLYDVEQFLCGRSIGTERRAMAQPWNRVSQYYYVREQADGPNFGGQVLKLTSAPQNAALAVPLAGPLPVQLSLPLDNMAGARRVA